MTQLSEHFTLEEFTKSNTAIRLGIKNKPTPAHLASMQTLCVKVLEPLRAHYGKPVKVSSGYRSLELNRAVRGSTSSQHSKGEAVDLEIAGVSNFEVACYVRDYLPHDQVILEYYHWGEPNSGWIHISYGPRMRHQALTTVDGKNYQPGLLA